MSCAALLLGHTLALSGAGWVS